MPATSRKCSYYRELGRCRRVAAGDINGDGKADIIAGAGPGGGPNVTVFSGVDGSPIDAFFAYDPHFTGGLYVAAGSW